MLPFYLVVKFSGNIQVSLTAHYGFVKISKNFQGVAQISARFGFPQLVSNSPGGEKGGPGSKALRSNVARGQVTCSREKDPLTLKPTLDKNLKLTFLYFNFHSFN